MEETVEEATGAQVRAAIMLATRIAEQAASIRERQLRAAQGRSQEEQLALQNRLQVERLAARSAVGVVWEDDYWNAATSRDLAETWEKAYLWRGQDPDIERAAEHMEAQLQKRYGFDARERGPVDEKFRAELASAMHLRMAAEEERAQARRERELAANLVLMADRTGDDLEAGLVDDIESAEQQEVEWRREADAHLTNAVDHEDRAAGYDKQGATEEGLAKATADLGQQHSAAEALRRGPGKVKRPRGRGAATVQEQTLAR